MEHKISKQDYSYECQDGCCTEFGTHWLVDGKLVYSGPDEQQALQNILAAFNIQAEIVGLDENGEEIWSL